MIGILVAVLVYMGLNAPIACDVSIYEDMTYGVYDTDSSFYQCVTDAQPEESIDYWRAYSVSDRLIRIDFYSASIGVFPPIPYDSLYVLTGGVQ